jgi:hypothetical protein
MGQEGENRVEEFKSKKREWQLTPAIAVDYTDTQILNRTLVIYFDIGLGPLA